MHFAPNFSIIYISTIMYIQAEMKKWDFEKDFSMTDNKV